jgi:hypothetical protein
LIKHIKQTLTVTDIALAGNRRTGGPISAARQATVVGAIC